MFGARVVVPIVLAMGLGSAAVALAPRAYEAQLLLAAQDDPAALADHAVARSLNSTVAEREIEAALAGNDADLAQSFLALARDRNLTVDPALAEKVRLASAEAASALRTVESFARGLITGEPQDLSGLAGTALGDLFVFGDIRDAVREGARLATGQQVDELILGLAGVGLAVTAGTYVTVGLAAPARAGVTVLKVAAKTSRAGSRMMAWITRSLRDIVDWGALSRASRGVSIAEPAVAVRAAREAVKVEKTRGSRAAGRRCWAGAGESRNASRPGWTEACGRPARHVANCAAWRRRKAAKPARSSSLSAAPPFSSRLARSIWRLGCSGRCLPFSGLYASLKRAAERVTERYCARRKRRLARRRRELVGKSRLRTRQVRIGLG